MTQLSTILWALAAAVMFAHAASADDLGSRDVLRLSNATTDDGEYKVAVHVINDEELAGLDIPLRFGEPGDPIELMRVEFAERVAEWDLTHAQIDNQAKTVIIGLISNLTGTRADANLSVSNEENTQIATLVFHGYEQRGASLTTFTTQRPGHALTFYYNRYEDGRPHVVEFTPGFEAQLEAVENLERRTLPMEFALSQNFPNPFNASTSFTLSLPEASDYSIRILNVAGQLVKSFSGHLDAGVHTMKWEGDNNEGNTVTSGVYFLSAEAGSFTETRRMVFLK